MKIATTPRITLDSSHNAAMRSNWHPSQGPEGDVRPKLPAERDRRWAADRLGQAADACAVAMRRWDIPPYGATATLLRRAVDDLEGVMPVVAALLPNRPDLLRMIDEAQNGLAQLAVVYGHDQIPSTPQPVAWLIARHAYSLRQAQSVLAGVTSSTTL